MERIKVRRKICFYAYKLTTESFNDIVNLIGENGGTIVSTTDDTIIFKNLTENSPELTIKVGWYLMTPEISPIMSVVTDFTFERVFEVVPQ